MGLSSVCYHVTLFSMSPTMTAVRNKKSPVAAGNKPAVEAAIQATQEGRVALYFTQQHVD